MHISSAKYRKFGILFNQSTKYYIFTKPLENRISGQSSQKLYLLDPSDLPHGWTPKIPWPTSCLFCLLPIFLKMQNTNTKIPWLTFWLFCLVPLSLLPDCPDLSVTDKLIIFHPRKNLDAEQSPQNAHWPPHRANLKHEKALRTNDCLWNRFKIVR